MNIAEVNIKEGVNGANRSLAREDVTVSIYSLRVLKDSFYVGILHESPQATKTLEDVVEYQIPFTEAPQDLVDRYQQVQAELEKHFFQTIYG